MVQNRVFTQPLAAANAGGAFISAARFTSRDLAWLSYVSPHHTSCFLQAPNTQVYRRIHDCGWEHLWSYRARVAAHLLAIRSHSDKSGWPRHPTGGAGRGARKALLA